MMHDAVTAVFMMMPLMFGSIGAYFAISEKKTDRFVLFVVASLGSLLLLAVLTGPLFKR